MLKNAVAPVQVIDPAYVESDCSLCGGRGQVGDSYPDALDKCPICEGTGKAERCPCGDRVSMFDVPDEHGVRLCGGPECDNGAWDRAVAAELAEVEAEGRRLLNGRDPEDDEGEVTCETVIDACSLSGADLIADGTFGRKAAGR